MKHRIIVLLCILSAGFSSCGTYRSEKSPDLVAQPKSMYISFDSRSVLVGLMDIENFATVVQNDILKACKARGIDAIFVHNKNTSLLSKSERQLRIKDFNPEVVLSITQEDRLTSEVEYFDVKITTPDQEKVLWRTPVHVSTFGIVSPKDLSRGIVYGLKKDGIFTKK